MLHIFISDYNVKQWWAVNCTSRDQHYLFYIREREREREREGEAENRGQKATVLENSSVHVTAVVQWSCFMEVPLLPSARQHPSYGDCLEVKSEYYQNCSMLGCVTQCSQ